MQIRHIASCAVWMLLLASFAMAGQAYLYLADDLPGESTDQNHRDWIDIQSFEITDPLKAQQISRFSIVKQVDLSTPKLFEACTTGRIFNGVKIDFVRMGQKEEIRVVQLIANGLVVESVTQSASSSADVVQETIALGFTEMTYIYTGENNDGSTFVVDAEMDTLDIDADEMPDAWEQHYGLDVGADDSQLDFDNDGLSNADEFRVGSDPTSASSFFSVSAGKNPENAAELLLTWNSKVDTSYLVQWSPDLVTPFTTIATVVATESSTTHAVTKSGSLGFYRIQLAP